MRQGMSLRVGCCGCCACGATAALPVGALLTDDGLLVLLTDDGLAVLTGDS